MSTWTHINGSIRFDSFFDDSLVTEKDLGVICTFDNWKDTDIPCGSEGSLRYKIVETGDESHLTRQTVVFWGDLRDFYFSGRDKQRILKYFNRIIKKKFVCQGVIQITTNCEDYILVYNEEKNKFILSPQDVRPQPPA